MIMKALHAKNVWDTVKVIYKVLYMHLRKKTKNRRVRFLTYETGK